VKNVGVRLKWEGSSLFGRVSAEFVNPGCLLIELKEKEGVGVE